jgi:protocatechuate 3,4-dioxygenase beta subunit
MRLAAILSTLALVALLSHAQAPASKPGSVDGTVVNFATGEPVRKASVRLDSQPKPGGTAHNLATKSDASGRFHFDSVEPGLYYAVGAQHDGYTDPQARYAIPAPFQVAEEQHVSGVTVKLVPLAVLSGHVQDEDGAPIPSAGVVVLRYSYEYGRRRLGATAAGEQTNDLGEFEILNLPPGRYYLQVAPPRSRNIPMHTRWVQPEEAYPITFYPNARQISEATPIDIAPGAHVGNLDFHMRKVAAYHIRGHVAGQTGGQPQTLDQLIVEAPGTRSGGIYQMGLQADGSFDIPGVVNGPYDVSYTHRRVGKSDTRYPTQSIHVADTDVNDLVFTAGPEIEVSGTISVEGPQPDKLNIYVALEPSNSAFSMGGMSAADGSFHIASVPMQLCHLDLRFPPEGYYVESIRLGDREVRDSDIDFSNGADAPLNIVLASGGGTIDGNVQTANGQPSAGTEVTLARSDGYAGRSDLLKRATTDAAGNFHIKDVAPGDYRVYAWEIDLDQSPRSAEFRNLFDGQSAAVTVGPNSKTSVQVNVILADDIARERSKLP